MKTELENLGHKLETKNGKPYYSGSLCIEGTGLTQLPEGLIVGGSLYIKGTGVIDTSKVNRNAPNFFEWRNREYIKIDGIFSKVVSHKENVYKICQIGEGKERYLVTDGSDKWSHGDTLKEAKYDLIYKISSRDKSKYENLTLEGELSFEEAIECYRVVSGACSTGTKMFIESNPNVKKDKYSVAEMTQITDGQYGSSEFKQFFKRQQSAIRKFRIAKTR